MIIFHQPRFPWNKGSHFPSLATWNEAQVVFSVVIIWPAWWSDRLSFPNCRSTMSIKDAKETKLTWKRFVAGNIFFMENPTGENVCCHVGLPGSKWFFFRFRWFFEDKLKHKNAKHIDMFLHKLKDIYINVKWTLSHSKTLWLCLQNHYGNMKEAQFLAFHVKVGDGHMRILGKAYPLRIQQGNHGETGRLWSFRHNNPLRLRTCSAQKITSSKRFCIFHIYHQMYMFGNFSWNSRETQGPTSGAHGIFPQRCGKNLKSQGFWRLVTQHGAWWP